MNEPGPLCGRRTCAMNSEYPLLLSPPNGSLPTVASDLEGTLTSGITVRTIHRYLEAHGRADDARRIFRRMMPLYLVRKFLRLDLREVKNDWMRTLMRAFRGAPADDVRHMTDWVVARSIWGERRVPVVQELLDHAAAGRRVVIVSGMPTPLLASLLAYLPGVEAIGTAVLPGENGFSGELEPQFNVGVRKMERLQPFVGANGKIHAAYGDTITDLPMLALSEHPVAVAPDRKLRQAAEAMGWRILEE